MHVVDFAKAQPERRKFGVGKVTEASYIFPPSKDNEYVKQASDLPASGGQR